MQPSPVKKAGKSPEKGGHAKMSRKDRHYAAVAQKEKIADAQARRNAAAAKAKAGDAVPVERPPHVEEDTPVVTNLDKLKHRKYVGLPFRMIQTVVDKRKEAQQAKADEEAKRVWDLMQLIEPGTRIKLRGLGRIGGVKFDGKLATVMAAFGSRFTVRLDAVDPDGTVREGQGKEIKVAPQNMEIWDEAFEHQLAEEEAILKKKAQEERKQIVKDLFEFKFSRFLGSEREDQTDAAGETVPHGQDGEGESGEPKKELEFEDLSAESPEEDLRAFHAAKHMKVKLGKRDTIEEIFDKVCKDWEFREDSIKIYDRLIRDAQSALRVGAAKPAIRNELRVFVVNPAFKIARTAINDARMELRDPIAYQVHSGSILSADESTVTFDQRPVEKGGASTDDDTYKTNTLVIVKGQGCGQEANILSYQGETRVATLLPWHTAQTNDSSKYEILGSNLEPMHLAGKARGGGRDFITLAEDADSASNFYEDMLVRIISGPGKSQMAKVQGYHGETKVATIDHWRYDKGWIEKTLDQDDENLALVMPTQKSKYRIMYQTPLGRCDTLHVRGRSQSGGKKQLVLASDAPEMDIYSGKGIRITSGMGMGQTSIILSYDGVQRLAKCRRWNTAIPDQTSRFIIVATPQDEDLLRTELKVMEVDAAAKAEAEEQERKRKMMIRVKFRAAAHVELLAKSAGEDIEANRLKEQRAAWAYYEEAGPGAGVADNIVYVGGKPLQVTWRSLVLDSIPAMEEVVVEEEDAKTGQVFVSTEIARRVGVMSWNGYALRWPLYAALQRRDDGSVIQPIQVLDADSGHVVYKGEANDWKVWQSLMQEGETLEERDDIFIWKGKSVLQPLTTTGDDGEDLFTVVENETGMLLYCGPDLPPDENEGKQAAAVPENPGLRQSGDAAMMAAIAEGTEEILRHQREESKGRVVTAKSEAAAHVAHEEEMLQAQAAERSGAEYGGGEGSGEGEGGKISATSSGGPMIQSLREEREAGIERERDPGGSRGGQIQSLREEREKIAGGGDPGGAEFVVHNVGRQDWRGPGDPLLWTSLMEESVVVAEMEGGVFRWRGMNVKQPVRDGVNQRVETENGDLVFFGENPNEAADFPSEEEQKDMLRNKKLAKMKIKQASKETDYGTYQGGMDSGKFQGDGVFTWKNGQVYSGQWFDDLREGTGTEIFPSYDNRRVDSAGELTFPYFEGQFRDGQRHGKGVFVLTTGEKYQGEFKYGVPDGWGTMYWPGGDYITCNWKAGVPSSDNVKNAKFKEEKRLKKKSSKKSLKPSPELDDTEAGYGFAERAI